MIRITPRNLVQLGFVFALFVVLALVALSGPIARFGQINKAHYLSNLGRWAEASAILDNLGPEADLDPAAMHLKLDVLMHVGGPFEARNAWEDYTKRVGAPGAGDYDDLYGFALLLCYEHGEAARYFASGPDDYAKSLAELIERPSLARFSKAYEATVEKYEKRWLYVSVIEWLGTRIMLDRDQTENAVARLKSLVDRFPGMSAFRFEKGFAHLRRGELGRGSSYVVSAYRKMTAKYPGESGETIRRAWREEVSDEIHRLILAGGIEDAIRMLRAIGGELELDTADSVKHLTSLDRLAPVEAAELALLLSDLTNSEASLAGDLDALIAREPWLRTLRALGMAGGEFDASVRGGRTEHVVSLRPIGSRPDSGPGWSERIAAGGGQVGSRVIVLRVTGSPKGGIGAGIAFDTGWKQSRAYVSTQAKWFAFALPMTADEPLEVALALTNGELPGIDALDRSSDRRSFSVEQAWLVDLSRASDEAGP